MKLPDLITKFYRVAERSWLESKPAPTGGANNDGADFIKQQHRSIEQPLMPW
jgi:hypothetical protein